MKYMATLEFGSPFMALFGAPCTRMNVIADDAESPYVSGSIENIEKRTRR